ncbi:peptide-methionine (S)-S-oxide reductase MsrA [Pseudomonadota bacterium]
MKKQLIAALLGFVCITSMANSSEMKQATFAGGCFWCMEHAFDEVEGVTETVSGYTGGHKTTPNYKEVSAGTTGHTEAVQVSYDPNKVSYKTLLDVFWRNIDPTMDHGQFCDYGNQYRPEIFYHNEAQRKQAEISKQELKKNKTFPQEIKVKITQESRFYPAEDYHQDYHHKNPLRYKMYRYGCGRDQRLETLWGKK